MKSLIILVIVVLLSLGLRLAMPRFGSSKAYGPVEVDGVMQLADCPDTPNCQGSQSSRPEQQLAAFNMVGVDKPIAHIAAVLANTSGYRVIRQDDHYLHVSAHSSLFNFVDDVEFLHTDGSDVQVRSASRLGVSDLGANLKRVEFLRSKLVSQ